MIEYWCGNTNKQAYTSAQKYIDAAARVRELQALAPDAIPRLRATEPAFKRMTTDTFTRAGLNIPPALVAALLARFRRIKRPTQV